MSDLLKVTVVGPSGPDIAGGLRVLSSSEVSRLSYAVVRVGMFRIRAKAFKDFQSHGVGRAIWGVGERKGTSFIGPGRSIKPGKPGNVIGSKVARLANDGFALVFTLTGLPAMTEEGGHTKAHVIQSQQQNRLALAKKYAGKRRFQGGKLFADQAAVAGIRKALAITVGGKQLFRLEVHHPGSAIPKQPFLEPSISAEAGPISSDLAKALNGLIERVMSKPSGKAA